MSTSLRFERLVSQNIVVSDDKQRSPHQRYANQTLEYWLWRERWSAAPTPELRQADDHMAHLRPLNVKVECVLRTVHPLAVVTALSSHTSIVYKGKSDIPRIGMMVINTRGDIPLITRSSLSVATTPSVVTIVMRHILATLSSLSIVSYVSRWLMSWDCQACFSIVVIHLLEAPGGMVNQTCRESEGREAVAVISTFMREYALHDPPNGQCGGKMGSQGWKVLCWGTVARASF
jgi:hypothetical protein